jgi:hypothetical protein
MSIVRPGLERALGIGENRGVAMLEEFTTEFDVNGPVFPLNMIASKWTDSNIF